MSYKEIQYGYCHCGCGRKTKIAERNYLSIGTRKGEPYKYVRGHTGLRQAGPEVPIGQKWCSECKTIKPLDEFFRNSNSPDKKQVFCKTCSITTHRNWYIRTRKQDQLHSLKTRLKKHGLSIDDYNRIKSEQNSACAICKRPEEKKNKSGIPMVLAIDHCHKTGKVRGLLCGTCNGALGWIGDDLEFLERAISYLKKHSE